MANCCNCYCVGYGYDGNAASAIIVSDKISDLENDVNNVQRDNEANNANLVSLVQGNASQIQENDAELARNENNYGTIWSSRYPINYGWGGIRSHRSPYYSRHRTSSHHTPHPHPAP